MLDKGDQHSSTATQQFHCT